MGRLFSSLKQTTVFLLAGQLFLQILPGRYEKYGKTLLGLMVLAQLAVPFLSLGRLDTGRFWEDTFQRYEEQLKEELPDPGIQADGESLGTAFVKQALREEIPKRLEVCAREEGVQIREVRTREAGGLQVIVEKAEGGTPEITPVEPVRIGDIQDNAWEPELLERLSGRFAAELGIEREQLEVIGYGEAPGRVEE